MDASVPDISEFATYATNWLVDHYAVAEDKITWHGQLPDKPIYVVMCEHKEQDESQYYHAFLLKTWTNVVLDTPYSVGYGDAMTVMYLHGQCLECRRVHFGQVKQFFHA